MRDRVVVKRIFLIMVTGSVLLATPAAPHGARTLAASPAVQGTPIPPGVSAVRITHGNVSLVNTLANTRVVVADVAPKPYNPNQPPGGEDPGHVSFRFAGYYSALTAPVYGPTAALVNVYPTAHFAQVKWDSQSALLQRLLVTHPNLARLDQLPDLPLQPAGQALLARQNYLAFGSGVGIRYLVRYASDVSPAVQGSVFYTYQGLTSDGKQYVSATFPVRVAILPATLPTNFDERAFEQGYSAYVARLVARLDAADEWTTFTPSLSQLDLVVRSIAVR
jgi:hypothetical protein